MLARAPDTPTQPRRRTTAAMPELPDDLISLSSLDGANLAAAQPAAAPMWSLLAHFETQHTQSFCSIATAAMLLNVLGVPRPIDPAYAPYPYFTQANVLGECALARPVTPNKNRAGGENISVATQPHPKSQTPTPTPTLARIHAADALTRRSHSSAHMARRWPSGAITSPAGRTRPSSTPQRAASRTSARVNPNPNPNPSPSPSTNPHPHQDFRARARAALEARPPRGVGLNFGRSGLGEEGGGHMYAPTPAYVCA